MENVLKKPMTIQEIKQTMNSDKDISGVVEVDLEDIIDTDYDGFCDLLSTKLTDTLLLQQIDYLVVGIKENNMLLVKVFGVVDKILEALEDEPLDFEKITKKNNKEK